jgi:rRNA processing protein Gar1
MQIAGTVLANTLKSNLIERHYNRVPNMNSMIVLYQPRGLDKRTFVLL